MKYTELKVIVRISLSSLLVLLKMLMLCAKESFLAKLDSLCLTLCALGCHPLCGLRPRAWSLGPSHTWIPALRAYEVIALAAVPLGPRKHHVLHSLRLLHSVLFVSDLPAPSRAFRKEPAPPALHVSACFSKDPGLVPRMTEEWDSTCC